MDDTPHIHAHEPRNAFGGMPPETGEFAITPEEAMRCRLQLLHFRKMLAKTGERPRLHTLIVEDRAFHRNLLYEVLHYTCSVTTCSNAIDGWVAYLKEAPDIAFLNIGLPDADGHALAQRIKLLDPISYVVMITASQDRYDVEMAKRNRVDGFIIKPFNKQKIDAVISRYMSARKSRTALRRTIRTRL